jgi:hypothetical protein
MLSVVIEYLSNNSMAVYVAAGFIAAGALIAYWVWFRPRAARLQSDLTRLTKALEVSGPDAWSGAREQARKVASGSPALRGAWIETEERIFTLPYGPRQLHVMIGAPRDVWSPGRLLSKSINLPLVEAVPNLLVGLGLLLTFFFLTVALTQATSALLDRGATADLTEATRGLLGAAGAKFMTSLAGLLASILWTIGFRRRMARLQSAADDVVSRIGRLASPAGGEMAVFAQVQLAGELHRTGAAHAESSKEISGRVGQHIELTEELLNEARDQTGTFKRFETDLAVSLAGAITTAFSPQMESMTERLVGAVEGLSNRIGTMNQQALEQMLQNFGGMLKQATDSEMGQLRETLAALSEQLAGAGQVIGNSAGAAAEKLDRAGGDLLTRVEQVADSLTTGAANLEIAAQGMKEAMNDLDVTIRQASDTGRLGVGFVRESLATADAVFGKLKATSHELGAAVCTLESIGGKLGEVADSVEELSREQRTVVDAVRQATPDAVASVQRVVDLLQQAVQTTAATMNQTKESMAATSKTLGTTVAQITEGVAEYSETLAQLHLRLDEQMAKAVGSLHKAVSGLEEAMEEFGERLDQSLART